MKKGQRNNKGGRNKKKRANNKSSGNKIGSPKLNFKFGDRVECFLGEAWEIGTYIKAIGVDACHLIMLDNGGFRKTDHATKMRKSDSPQLQLEFPVGSRIECRLAHESEGRMWGKEWRPGVVVKANKDWAKNMRPPYLIKFDDEEKVRCFIGRKDVIRRAPLRFSVGDRVEVYMMKDNTKRYLPGTIVELWPKCDQWEEGGTAPYAVRLDEGWQLVYRRYDIDKDIVSSDIPPVPATSFSKGDRVECKVGGRWRQGTVMQSNLDWIERDCPPFFIRFDTGECTRGGCVIEMRACGSDAVVPISEALGKLGLSDSESLFETPPPAPECPICFLPLPVQDDAYKNQPCCGAKICMGCLHARWSTAGVEDTCPFCRAPELLFPEEIVRKMRNRAELKDAENMFYLGCSYEMGWTGSSKDLQKAHQLYVRAADLGSPLACFEAYQVFDQGKVFERDEARAMHYLEKGAKLGEVKTRHMLGIVATKKNAWDLANRHWKISASLGYQLSLERLKESYKEGMLSKEDLAECLRAHQKSVSEAWSEDRATAAALFTSASFYFENALNKGKHRHS